MPIKTKLEQNATQEPFGQRMARLRKATGFSQRDHRARQILAAHEFAAAMRVRDTITNIASIFNEDELVYLQYRRHVECHPLQNAYRIRFTGKAFQESVHHRLLDKAMTVDDSDAACVRLFAKHGFSKSRIAINFAQRVLQPVLELQLAAPAWFGIPMRGRR